MFHLAWSWMLVVLPLPWLMRWVMPPVRPLQRASIRLPFDPGGLPRASISVAPDASRVLRLSLLTTWCALILAAMRPQWIGDPLAVPVTGRDIMLLLDVSTSMGKRDEHAISRRVDRLATIKTIAGEFIERRRGDRLGLILFGSKPYLQVPLTFDRAMASVLLREARVGLAGGETAIGDALGLTVHQLRERPAQSRVAILLTDGENNAGAIDPLRAASLSAANGLKVYTIGLSNTAQDGDRLDEDTLREIASVTGGRYFHASDSAALAQIYAEIDQLEPATHRDEVLRPAKELFYWPLAFAYLSALFGASLPWLRFVASDVPQA